MKIISSKFILLLLLPALVPAAKAQTSLQTMRTAAAFRQELVAGLVAGAETPEKALQRLGKQKVASGLSTLSPNEDQAQAALGIAYDLMGRERPDLAEYFFSAAEQSLVQAARGSGAQGKQKANLLKTLAVVRSHYLGKREEAKNDMAEAARLVPEDREMAALAVQLRQRSEGVSQGKSQN